MSANYQNNFAICGFGYKSIKNQTNECIYKNILKVIKIDEKEEKSSEELSSIKVEKKDYDIDQMMKNSYNEIKKQQEKCIKVEVNESVNDVETKAETEIKQESKKPEFESLYNEKYFDNPMNE